MKQILFPFTAKDPRSGEGSAILLKDGRVFMIYSKFTGTADHDRSDLAGGILDPVTGTFSGERVLFGEGHYLNQMSVSLERFSDGTVGCVFLRKLSAHHDLIIFSRSRDECRSWSRPEIISNVFSSAYFTVNNDRLRQLSSGRLTIPVSVGEEEERSYRSLLYSDDSGTTWKVSKTIQPCAAPPKPEPYAAETSWEEICSFRHREQEPGVEECADGTLFYYCRTCLGFMYGAWSRDRGETFTELEPIRDIVSPLAPQSIRRQPGTARLWCVWNDRSGVAFGDAKKMWGWRTPLTLGYSDDNGRTWTKFRQIEDDGHNYCYTSMTFIGKTLLLSYYESENRADGTRRNLASLKIQTVEL
jgi:hypothetical protein